MEIKVRNRSGIILQTKDKYCDDNITISLDDNLFDDRFPMLFNKTITYVTKEDMQGVTEIYPKFFYGCKLLEKVELVDTITTIGQEAFTNCSSLKEINIPEGVTTIPTLTFRNCTSLEKVTLPTTLTTIGADAFELNTKTKELHISDLSKYVSIDFEDAGSVPLYSSEDIERALYLNGEKLVNVTLTTNIKKYAFIKASSIETLNVENGVKTIGRYSLASMYNLKNVFLPNTLTSVDSTAFNNDTNLEVLVHDNTISFYMYKCGEVIDEIILSFDNKERTIYEYICIRLLVILFGNVYIYNKGNLIYNNKHKSYLKLVVNDDIILSNMIKLINMQNDMVISDNLNMKLDIKKSFFRRRYSDNFIKQLDDRIDFSKKLLRRI